MVSKASRRGKDATKNYGPLMNADERRRQEIYLRSSAFIGH